MARKSDIIKINLPAGLVRANDMLTLLNIFQQFNIPEVRSGGRQQLYVRSLIADTKKLCEAIRAAGFFLEKNTDLNSWNSALSPISIAPTSRS